MGKLLKLLPHLAPKVEVPYGSDSPIVTCENPACAQEGPSHLMKNIMICCGSPGHPAIIGFQCPHVEHWACSLACQRIVLIACYDEHIAELIQLEHNKLGLKVV